MNESGIRLDYPILVHGGDGTTLWEGLGVVGNVSEGVNTGAAAITVASVISVDSTNFVMMSPDAAASTALTPQKRCVCMAHSTTYNHVLGVALNAAAIGSRVIIAGQGSVVPVRCVGTTFSNNNLLTTTTAGLAVQSSSVATGITGTVGKVVKVAGTTGGTTDSGSANYNIALVNPL